MKKPVAKSPPDWMCIRTPRLEFDSAGMPVHKRVIVPWADLPGREKDEYGVPIIHDSGKCDRCKKSADKFSTPWYAFKYQILGYCEKCTIELMGESPDLTGPAATIEISPVRPLFRDQLVLTESILIKNDN